MFAYGRKYMSHDLVHRVEIQSSIFGDIIEWVPSSLFVKDLAFIRPYFPHFPVPCWGIRHGYFPTGLGSFSHGKFIVFGIGEVECGEKGCVESVDYGTKG